MKKKNPISGFFLLQIGKFYFNSFWFNELSVDEYQEKLHLMLL